MADDEIRETLQTTPNLLILLALAIVFVTFAVQYFVTTLVLSLLIFMFYSRCTNVVSLSPPFHDIYSQKHATKPPADAGRISEGSSPLTKISRFQVNGATRDNTEHHFT